MVQWRRLPSDRATAPTHLEDLRLERRFAHVEHDAAGSAGKTPAASRCRPGRSAANDSRTSSVQGALAAGQLLHRVQQVRVRIRAAARTLSAFDAASTRFRPAAGRRRPPAGDNIASCKMNAAPAVSLPNTLD